MLSNYKIICPIYWSGIRMCMSRTDHTRETSPLETNRVTGSTRSVGWQSLSTYPLSIQRASASKLINYRPLDPISAQSTQLSGNRIILNRWYPGSSWTLISAVNHALKIYRERPRDESKHGISSCYSLPCPPWLTAAMMVKWGSIKYTHRPVVI